MSVGASFRKVESLTNWRETLGEVHRGRGFCLYEKVLQVNHVLLLGLQDHSGGLLGGSQIQGCTFAPFLVVNTGKILDFQLWVVLEKIEGIEIVVAAPIFLTICIVSNSTYFFFAIFAIPGDLVIVTVMAIPEVIVASGLSIECFAGVLSPPNLEIALGLVNSDSCSLDEFFRFVYNISVKGVKNEGWVLLDEVFDLLKIFIRFYDLVLQRWLVVFVTVSSFRCVLIAVIIRQVGSSGLYRDFLCINGTTCGSAWVCQCHVG